MAYIVRFPHFSAPTSFLLTSFLLLTIVHLAKQQISISGACQARCEAQRLKGHPYAFKFTCEDSHEACKRDCKSCPKQVCDETTSYSSVQDWHCPAMDFKISDECKNYCNKFRYKGNPVEITVYCSTLVTPEDQDECKSQCNKCSEFFCDSENNRIYCPWDKFDGNCKLECDKTRVRDLDSQFTSHVDRFEFRCSEFYNGLYNEEQLCRSTLRYQCPAYVQDEGDIDKYHCPSVTDADLSGECKAFCDKHTNPKYFHCPRDAPKMGDPLPLIKRSYKGPCKHRCDVSQGGGPQAFSLHCQKFYETPQEKQRCIQICTEECLEQDCRNNE